MVLAHLADIHNFALPEYEYGDKQPPQLYDWKTIVRSQNKE